MLAVLALSALLAAASNLLLRHTMSALGDGGGGAELLLEAAASPLVLAGLLGYAASHLLWLNVLSQARVGAAFPVFVSSMFVMVLAGAALLLGEAMTAPRLGGAALIAAGILVAEHRRRGSAPPEEAS